MRWNRIVFKRRFHSPDIPEDFAATMFHDAKMRMRTWKYVRSASNISAPSTIQRVTLRMGFLTKKDSTDDKKGFMHRVADLTFVKE